MSIELITLCIVGCAAIGVCVVLAVAVKAMASLIDPPRY